jgi:hypothetical protein
LSQRLDFDFLSGFILFNFDGMKTRIGILGMGGVGGG